jgi:Protein of unknown function (DUF2934)
MQDMEQAIRERAYQLWVDSGFEHGNAGAHWLAAQREILSASLGEIGRVIASDTVEASAKPKKTRAPRKKRAA